jgi:hypothetical protein
MQRAQGLSQLLREPCDEARCQTKSPARFPGRAQITSFSFANSLICAISSSKRAHHDSAMSPQDKPGRGADSKIELIGTALSMCAMPRFRSAVTGLPQRSRQHGVLPPHAGN